MNNPLTNALPIMVNNYSKMFGVSVRMQGTSAYTNGKTITIPRLDINNPAKARLAYGYLAHESAHVRYTDFKLIKQEFIKEDLLRFSLFNILEDSRIEALISREYIGVYENLSLLNDYYEHDWISFCQNVSKINVLNVILSFIQSYSQVHCQHFFSSRERAVKLYTHLKSRMKEHLLKRIAKLTKECSKAKSSKEVLYFVDEIYEILASDENDFKNEKLKFMSEQKLNDELQNYEEKHGTIKDEHQKNFIKELIKLKLASKGDPSNVTPSQSAAKIVEENGTGQSSSSREDLGLFNEKECQPGRHDYIRHIDGSYALRRALNMKARSYVEAFGFTTDKGSRIDPLKAQKVCVGETNIFKDRVSNSGFSTSVHLLVDVSSSMLTSDGLECTRCEEACKVALMICMALEGIDGIKTMATYFPGDTSEYEIALRDNEKVSHVASRFDQRPRGSTPLAQGLWYAFQKIEKLECRRNIILVITDGMPDSVNNVDTCFKYAKNRNIEIYGLSIRSSLILKLFEKAQVLENASELEKVSFDLFSKLFDSKEYSQEFEKLG